MTLDAAAGELRYAVVQYPGQAGVTKGSRGGGEGLVDGSDDLIKFRLKVGKRTIESDRIFSRTAQPFQIQSHSWSLRGRYTSVRY